MRIALRDIYEDLDDKTLMFMYKLLQEREPHQAISHKTMPSWDQHTAFVRREPYAHWWMIISEEGEWVGSIYLTKNNEIGVSVSRAHIGGGIGRDAVTCIMDMFPGETLYANVNPANEQSRKMFERLGFAHIQNTYRIR